MTRKEREVLSYIIQFKLTNSYAPTIQEICVGTYTTGSSYILEILQKLRAAGFISYRDHESRSIVVLRFDIN